MSAAALALPQTFTWDRLADCSEPLDADVAVVQA